MNNGYFDNVRFGYVKNHAHSVWRKKNTNKYKYVFNNSSSPVAKRKTGCSFIYILNIYVFGCTYIHACFRYCSQTGIAGRWKKKEESNGICCEIFFSFFSV